MSGNNVITTILDDVAEERQRQDAKWGEQKFEEYVGLIEEALQALGDNPRAGRAHPEIDALAWTYRIAKPRRGARRPCDIPTTTRMRGRETSARS